MLIDRYIAPKGEGTEFVEYHENTDQGFLQMPVGSFCKLQVVSVQGVGDLPGVCFGEGFFLGIPQFKLQWLCDEKVAEYYKTLAPSGKIILVLFTLLEVMFTRRKLLLLPSLGWDLGKGEFRKCHPCLLR
jgi:hypothetical protein